MQKIVDTYSSVLNPITGGRCQKWWEANRENLNTQKNKKHRTEDVPVLDIHKFLDEFNLKGVEFGNWLQQGERYDHLLAAGYALHELSKLVGKNIGFNHNVGIAFGARGMRGALAHFEPIANMINLTKMKGHGTLAHEYGHVLDYNIGAFMDRNSGFAYLSGGRSIANQLKVNTGKELRAMVNQIVDYVKTTDSYKKLFKKTLNEYWLRRTEVFARFFEQYVAYKTKSSNSYLCSSWNNYIKTGNIAFLQEDEFMQILPVADKLIKRIKDYCSEDGLPLKVTPYPALIEYKPKTAKEQPKAAAHKQTQDTKATKKEAVVLSKEVKDAIMDRLMRLIDNGNYGLFSKYEENIRTPRILFQNKIKIDYSKGYEGTVTQNGKLIATIEGNFAKKKKDGMHKQLKPTVTYL